MVLLRIPEIARRSILPGACAALLIGGAARAQDPATATVPEASTESPVQPPAQTAAEEEQTESARRTYLRLIGEKRYAEAAEIAAQLVERIRQLHGARSPQHTASLTDLGNAQLHLGNLADAENNFRAAIALIEQADGPASPRLIEPLIGLGHTFMRGGFYPPANDAYERALLLNHAAAGFYNLEQGPILDGLSESYLALGRLADANARQRVQVGIQERRSGGAHPDVAQALYKLARWYNRTGQYAESREAWQQARRVIREAGGPGDPAQVEAMIGEALSYANEGDAPASVSTLKRALDLLDAQPEADRARRAEVLVTLGDLYIAFRRPKSARQQYERAWAELSAEEALSARRDEYFSQPSRITGPRLPDIVGADGREQAAPRTGSAGFAPGFVVARMNVDADGSARDAVVIESEPPGLLDEQVLRALAGTAFRPRLADGTAVASEDVQFRHEFRYPREAGNTPADAASDPSPAGDKGGPIAYPGEENGNAGG